MGDLLEDRLREADRLRQERMPEKKETQISPSEAVHHPSRYGGDTTYEVIKVLEAWGITDFYLGNSIKYIARPGKSLTVEKRIEDLEKSLWFLSRKIQRMKEGKDDGK